MRLGSAGAGTHDVTLSLKEAVQCSSQQILVIDDEQTQGATRVVLNCVVHALAAQEPREDEALSA